jgi:hypothetical protein
LLKKEKKTKFGFKNNSKLAPPVAIDLLWHAHQVVIKNEKGDFQNSKT